MEEKKMNIPVDEKWSCTQLKVQMLSYKWRITNFTFCLAKDGEGLHSPNFFSDAYSKIVWSVEVTRSNDYIGVYLNLVSSPISEVIVKFRFYIIDPKAVVTGTQGFAGYIDLPKTFYVRRKHGIDHFASKYDLRKSLQDKDEVTILCEIKFVVDTVHISDQSNIVPECKLVESLEKLLDDDKFCDVTIIVGNHEFPAHKSLLAVRSNFFAAMFKHETEESKSNRVTITDTNHEVFYEVLRFIYTGKVRNLDKMAGELLAAADKYALEKLKSMCEKSLCTNLSIKTAAKSLELAYPHCMDQLQAKTVEFTKTHLEEVKKTADWRTLTAEDSHLIKEAFPCICTCSAKTARI